MFKSEQENETVNKCGECYTIEQHTNDHTPIPLTPFHYLLLYIYYYYIYIYIYILSFLYIEYILFISNISKVYTFYINLKGF